MAWITQKKRVAIYRRDSYTCHYCGKIYNGDKLTLDHIKARANGGTNKPNNLITACKHCNSQKGKRTAKQYVQFLENMKIIGYGMAKSILRDINNSRNRKLIF